MNSGMRFPVIGVLVGGLVALFGTYWDDAWHTDLGRDTFFSPPHLALYGGVALAGAAVMLWLLLRLRTHSRWRDAVGHPPLLLALVGILATLASAPIDEIWHTLFGRDAVIWSPPHMLGVAALLCVASGALLEVDSVAGRAAALLRPLAGALLLGVLLVPVLEYETDVPQFPLLWYLPVLTLGAGVAFRLIEMRRQGVWDVTFAAGAYTLLRIGIAGILTGMNHSLPLIPPIIVPALLFDLTARTHLSRAPRAVLMAMTVYMSYVLLHQGPPAYLRLDVTALVIGLPIAALLAWLAFTATRPQPHTRMITTALLLLTALTYAGAAPPRALAHDPGQGEAIGTVHLTVEQNYPVAVLNVVLAEHGHQGCADVRPRAVVGRRAGTVLRAPLQQIDGCTYTGSISVNAPGRWFIYVELEHNARPTEAWLPVVMDDNRPERTEKLSELYLPPAAAGSLGQAGAGTLLYGLNIALLAAAVLVSRRKIVQA